MRARGPSRPPRSGWTGVRKPGRKPGLPPWLWVPGLELFKQTIQILHRFLRICARVTLWPPGQGLQGVVPSSPWLRAPPRGLPPPGSELRSPADDGRASYDCPTNVIEHLLYVHL